MTQTDAAPPGGIFISYRRIDSQWAAKALYDDFRKAFDGVKVFMDIEAIERAVSQCRVMVVLIGEKWLDACDAQGNRRLDNPLDFVRIEVATALSRGIRVIPVMIDGAPNLRQEHLPDALVTLARRNAARMDADRFQGDMLALVKGVAMALERAATLPPPPSPEDLKTEARAASAATPGSAPSPVLEDAALRTLAKIGLNPSALTQASFERAAEGAGVEAEQLARIALHRLEADDAPHPDRLTTRFAIAQAQLVQGRAAEAEASWRALLPDEERVQGVSHPDTLGTRFAIARAQLAQGRAAEAEAAWRALLPDYERVQGASHPDTLTTRFSIARARFDLGRAAEAEATWHALLRDYERERGASHPDTLFGRALLVAARARLGDVVGALEAAGGLTGDLVAVFGDGNPKIGRVLVPLGELAAAEGDRAGAARRFDEAEALYRSKLVPEAFEYRELAEARARWLPAPAEPGA